MATSPWVDSPTKNGTCHTEVTQLVKAMTYVHGPSSKKEKGGWGTINHRQRQKMQFKHCKHKEQKSNQQCTSVLEIHVTVGHWTLSDQISKLSDQFYNMVGHDVRAPKINDLAFCREELVHISRLL